MSLDCPGPKVARLVAALLLMVPAHALGEEGSHCDPPPKSPSAAAAPGTEVRLVDAELLDPDGRPVRFRSEVVADKIVVMDFVFTTCTTVCPVLSAVLARVQGRLGERQGPEVRLVSISVDPARDTPARLKAYSTGLRAKAGWTWLTGSQENIKQVLEGLGAYTPGFVNHTPMVLIGDPRTGAWTRLNGFPSDEQIIAKVNELAAAREEKSRVWFTDTRLVTQEGKQVRFYSDVLEGRVVVISFIFTRCTSACPLIAARLNQVREQLGEQFGREVTFISISVDPEYDTPERLKEFARKQRAAHAGWTFLTGKKEDVKQVIARLGQSVGNPEEHSTLLIAGNEKRRHWARIPPDASVAAVAERVRLLARE